MSTAAPASTSPDSLRGRVRRAVLWRSLSQLAAQLVQWSVTFLVIRILSPRDYGLFAMTQVVLVLLNMLNGYGLASGLIRQAEVSARQVRQLFGMLIVLNGGLALAQVLLAPVAAAYYRQPLVADLLRVQALLYLATPFIALPYALLSRTMEFRGQASANVAGSLAGAGVALGGAMAGWGVWTLVAAPIALFAIRGAMMTAATGLIRPLFDFRGAGDVARFGGVMAAGQMFWFVQSQADIFIAGRWFSPHALGIYSTALLLAQIFVAKVLPPLNEVAFSAYARLNDSPADAADALAQGFARAAQVVMAAALPFYLGLATTAEPLVLSVLGEKWVEVVPVTRLLALAMPFMTMQALLAPACDARGRPGIGVRNGATGAVILAAGFALGVRYGPLGLAWAWFGAYPIYLAISLRRSLPVIGLSPRRLGRLVGPTLAAALAMAAVVAVVDRLLPAMPPSSRLLSLGGCGIASYGLALRLLARGTLDDLLAFARRAG